MQRAFTLTELLVVMAIIALMAALLLPVIGMIRDRALRARCAGNIRQLTMGIISYSTDNDGLIPRTVQMGGTEPRPCLIWSATPPTTLDLNLGTMADLAPGTEGMGTGGTISGIWRCPALGKNIYDVKMAMPFYHMPYSYWAMRTRWPVGRPPTRPDEITDTLLSARLLLWADNLYGVNFGANGFPANHSRVTGDRITNWSAIPGNNRGFGDGHVEWTGSSQMAIDRLVSFDQTLPGAGGGGTFTWY